MSTIISALHAPLAFSLNFSFVSAMQWLSGAMLGAVLLYLFEPLLRGLVSAFLLIVKLRSSKKQDLAHRNMIDAIMLKRMAASKQVPLTLSVPA